VKTNKNQAQHFVKASVNFSSGNSSLHSPPNISGPSIRSNQFTPTVQKPEGYRVKASEGEVVVLYFEPSVTQNLKSSGFPRCFKGKQHGKIDPILRIHQWRYPRICHFAMILAIIADHYLIFAMLFMQLRAHSKITSHFIRRSIPTGGVAKARNIQIFLRFRALPVERLND
jgi:hypothetical protein